MAITIGVRREDLNKRGEQRVAITPLQVADLTQAGHQVLIQPGIHPQSGDNKRAFSDLGYQEAGAEIREDLSQAQLIFGLKEVKVDQLEPKKTYLFFSHTHKGQVKNRPLLKAMMEKGITLLDYELITNSEKQRLLTAFTYFAGYAGMTDSLWTLGERLARKGVQHPMQKVPQSIQARTLEEVKDILRSVGEEIKKSGTPADLPPLITGFLGNGKTSTGAQEMYDLLPVKEIGLEELADTFHHGSRKQVYKLVMKVADMFKLKADSPYQGEQWDARQFYQIYRREPQHFESNLDRVFPFCTVLMNCITWSPEYPRLLSRDMAEAWSQTSSTLEVIGDITCDPEGSIEFSQETWIDQPVFVYDPLSRQSHLGFDGEGIAVMAVTNLPCEFSADASSRFAGELSGLHTALASADWEATSLAESGLPPALSAATILWRGELTDAFAYMEEFVPAEKS